METIKNALTRPEIKYGAGAGLARHDHFQIAYNTTDMDKALALFSELYGIKEYQKIEGPTPAGGMVRMYIGWAGGVMYELLWAEGPGSEVFRAGLPDEGFAIRPHHLGYYVPTEEVWNELLQEIELKGLKTVHTTHVPGFLRAIIVEQPVLGHYLEYILPEAGGFQFFETAPSN